MRAQHMSAAVFAGVLGMFLAATPSQAELQYYRAILDSANEGSGGTCTDTGSPATGTAWFLLDTVANTVNFSVVFSGLVAAENGAHVHGPATECNAAGILFPLALGNPKIGSYTVSAGQKADMQNGLHYINIHSTTHGAGEIRGQIQRVDSTQVCFAANLDGAQEGGVGGVCSGVATSATGTGKFTLDMASLEVQYTVIFSGLTSPEVAAHVHGPALPCFSASPLADGTLPSGSPKIGTYSVTAAEAVAMLNELHYVNVHSSNFPAGEIRGQLLTDAHCIPATSTWGLLVLGLLVLSAGTVVSWRSRDRSLA